MKKLTCARLASFALLLFACQPTTTTTPPDPAKDIEAVKAVMKNIEATWNAGNWDATDYAGDCVTMPPGMEANLGKEAAIKRWESFLAANTSTWTIDAFDDVQVSGDLAVVRYTVTDKVTPKTGGEAVTSRQKGIDVLKRQGDGSWKVIIEIWNDN